MPPVYVTLESLPLSANGKVDRKRLPAPAGGRSSLEAAYVAPRTEWERTLAGIWQRVLGVEQVGVRDNFFALGGDSIRSIQVLAAAKEAQLALTLEDLFRQQTIEELAVVAAGKTGEAPAERTAAWSLVSDGRPVAAAGGRGRRVPAGGPAGGDAVPQRVQSADGRVPRRVQQPDPGRLGRGPAAGGGGSGDGPSRGAADAASP